MRLCAVGMRITYIRMEFWICEKSLDVYFEVTFFVTLKTVFFINRMIFRIVVPSFYSKILNDKLPNISYTRIAKYVNYQQHQSTRQNFQRLSSNLMH